MVTESGAPANSKAALVIFLTGIYLLLVLRFGWVGDDAAITFRVVDNFLNGYGLRWNISERVQTFTHPLWMLMLIPLHWISKEVFLTTIIFSALLAVSAFVLLMVSLCDSLSVMVLCGGLWMLSVAIVDYSTSGLENCLAYILLLLFVREFLVVDRRESPIRLMLVGGLIGLTRMDLLLMILPALLVRMRWTVTGVRSALVGFLPLILWEIFSTLYYGFPFPNTAYAKLGAGVPEIERCYRGLLYLIHHLWADPVTLLILVMGTALPLVQKQVRIYPLVLGLLLYLAYVFSIGGDFMAGRMLALPAVLGVLLVSQVRSALIPPATSVIILLSLLVLSGRSKLDTGVVRDFSAPEWLPQSGIVDEREFYFRGNGLPNYRPDGQFPRHVYRLLGENMSTSPDAVFVQGAIGMQGYYAGPAKHLVDHYGLGDPLLARIPAFSNPYWRIGHMQRTMPAGYIESLKSGSNLIENLKLKEFYEKLRLITQGDLLNSARLKVLLRMNLGLYDHLIESEDYRYPDIRVLDTRALQMPQADGAAWNAPGAVRITNQTQVRFDISPPRPVKLLKVAVDHNDRYTFRLYRHKELLSTSTIAPLWAFPAGLRNRTVIIDPGSTGREVTAIVVTAVSENDNASLGFFQIE